MNKVTMTLAGVEQLQRALKLTDAAARQRTVAAIRRGTEVVVAGAEQRVHRVTGELASTIRAEYSKDGLTGFAKVGYGKLQRRSRSSSAKRIARLKKKRAGSKSGMGAFAPVVERGDPRRHHLPHPFMIPAFTQATPGIVSDLRGAIDGAIPEELRG